MRRLINPDEIRGEIKVQLGVESVYINDYINAARKRLASDALKSCPEVGIVARELFRIFETDYDVTTRFHLRLRLKRALKIGDDSLDKCLITAKDTILNLPGLSPGSRTVALLLVKNFIEE